MQYSQNFYTNVALFVLALVVLGLSIWAFVAPCKKDGFGDKPNLTDPKNTCCPSGVSECQYWGYTVPCPPACKSDEYCSVVEKSDTNPCGGMCIQN